MKWNLSDTAHDLSVQVRVIFFDQDLKLMLPQDYPGYRDLQGLLIAANVSGETGELLHSWTEQENCWTYLCGYSVDNGADAHQQLRLAAAAVNKAVQKRFRTMSFILDTGRFGSEKIAAIVEGASLAMKHTSSWKSSDKNGSVLESATIVIQQSSRFESAVKTAFESCNGTHMARLLTDTPANDLTPEILAEKAVDVAKTHNFGFKVMEVDALEELGMQAILRVGAGSINAPRLIVIDSRPDSDEAPIALLGKGITFDSGGISIKPSKDMHEMRGDMGGAAAVLATTDALARLNYQQRFITVIPAAENMTGSNAQRPGDVIRAFDGTTIEVLNTDAEGRLVLADALAWTLKEYKPRAMIDLATLTGAVSIALGSQAIGMMGNNQQLMDSLVKSGNVTYERVWQLPMFSEYKKQLESSIADLQNIGGRDAGTITAGWFLRHFVGECPWVHLDIAGVSWISAGSGYLPKGPTGAGVRLLVELLRNHWPAEL
jgi:leucyl aminopeptidase